MGMRFESARVSAAMGQSIIDSGDIEDCYASLDGAAAEQLLNLDSMWAVPMELINYGEPRDEPLFVGMQISDEENGQFAFVGDIGTVTRVSAIYDDVSRDVLADRFDRVDLVGLGLHSSESAMRGAEFREWSIELAWRTVVHLRTASEHNQAIVSIMSM